MKGLVGPGIDWELAVRPSNWQLLGAMIFFSSTYLTNNPHGSFLSVIYWKRLWPQDELADHDQQLNKHSFIS